MSNEPKSASELRSSLTPALAVPPGTSKLSYSRLQTATTIRLLQILSEAGEDILRCNMLKADLAHQQMPTYSALSYTWHDESLPDTPRPILVNGQLLEVSVNLWNFLDNYRHSTGERIIWIDQICINQDDLDERSQQIQHMCAIYKRAYTHLFWVGEPGDEDDAAWGLLSRLSKLQLSFRRSGNDFPTRDDLLNPIYMAMLGLPPFPSTAWESVMHFLSRPAFHRAWILQEVAVSKAAVVCSGFWMQDFTVFGLAAAFLVETSWVKTLHGTYPSSGAAGFLTAMFNCRSRHAAGEIQRLDLLFASTRRFRATKPVDKVFSLVSLAESGMDRPLPLLIKPDYRKSVVEVYRDATLHCISEGSLDVLSGVEDSRFRCHAGLPSWVPDFSVHQVISILAEPPRDGLYTFYTAAATRPISFRTLTDPNILVLSTYIVDTIARVSPNPMEGEVISPQLGEWAKMLDFQSSYQPARQLGSVPIVEAFWRTLVGNAIWRPYDYPVPKSWALHFATLVLETMGNLALSLQGQDDPVNEAAVADLLPGLLAIGQALKKVLPEEDLEKGDGSIFEASMHHASWGRRFFVTKKGYMGIAHPGARAGDAVALFSGGRVPFIVRGVSGNSEAREYYRIVGEAYVHGVMDGELLDLLSEKDWVEVQLQ
ncbi:hypothetical protein ACJ41O_000478 [Fusarium nematophilum]